MGPRSRSLLLAIFCVVVASLGFAVHASAAAAYTETLLSNERDTSRWAYVAKPAYARAEPSAQANKVKKLERTTEDGTTELVLTLSERVFPDGQVWTLVRLPMKGVGRSGWVPRGSLGKYHVVHTRVEIDRDNYMLRLYENEVKTFEAKVAVGRKGKWTPKGDFYVRERLTTTDPDGFFGAYAIGLSAYADFKTDWPGGAIIGIQGTDDPESVPGRATRGNIRLRNKAMKTLFKKLPAGTPVKIL